PDGVLPLSADPACGVDDGAMVGVCDGVEAAGGGAALVWPAVRSVEFTHHRAAPIRMATTSPRPTSMEILAGFPESSAWASRVSGFLVASPADRLPSGPPRPVGETACGSVCWAGGGAGWVTASDAGCWYGAVGVELWACPGA